MIDPMGRKIEYLRLSVTDRCNYRCIYCMPEHGICKRRHEDMLSVEQMIELSQAAVTCGIRKIRLTGGEPLVHKGIIALCNGLKQLPQLETLSLTTNGSLLPSLAQPLYESGVDRLNISLDTLIPERYEKLSRLGNLNDVLQGWDMAEKVGFQGTKINVVLMGGINDDEIESFVQLTRDRAVTVRFIELMPIGECKDWPKDRFIPASTVLERVPELMLVGSDGVAETYRMPGALGLIGLIRPMSHLFCKDCNRIRITADGKLKPCLHSKEEIDLRTYHGSALIKAIEDAVALKPERHYLVENSTSFSQRRMNEIGG